MKIIYGLFLLVLTSCNTPCDTPTSVASMISGSLSSVGSCNEAGAKLLSADVTKLVSGLGLCDENKKSGVISSIVCAPVISALGSISATALDSKYPGCNFSKAFVAPEEALIALCVQLPF